MIKEVAMMIKIAVDVMGGDYAPQEIIKGIEKARDTYNNLEFNLFGSVEKMKSLIQNMERLNLIQADSVITMEDEPVRAVRRKKNSSLVLAAQSVKESKSDVFLSAGNSGAVLAAGIFVIGRIKGIDRPALTTTLPVVNEKQEHDFFTMLDVGANADNKLANLSQFAILGSFYGKYMNHLQNPRIGLLNNGTEFDKGDQLHKQAYEALNNLDEINFIGNVESRELLNGAADIVVTDGFTGNAALKAIEGTALSMLHLIKYEIKQSVLAQMGYLFERNAFHRVGQKMNYQKYGGAVLLGVQKPVIKIHGSSKAETVFYGIKQAKEVVESKLVEKTIDFFTKK